MHEEKTCIDCGNAPFYAPDSIARRPGHIYSQAGKREFKISQLCEFCFDAMFSEEDDEY